MKKAVAVILAVFTLTALCGCGAKAAVTSSALTDREKSLMSMESEHSFVFDYNSGDWQWVSLWADEYRKGKITGTYDLGSWSLDMDDKGTVVIYIPRTNYSDAEQLNFSAMAGGALITGTDVIPGFSDAFDYGVSWQTFEPHDIPDSGKKTLLCIRCSNNGFSPLEGDFYKYYESNMERIADDEITYVIGCTFSSEQPKLPA